MIKGERARGSKQRTCQSSLATDFQTRTGLTNSLRMKAYTALRRASKGRYRREMYVICPTRRSSCLLDIFGRLDNASQDTTIRVNRFQLGRTTPRAPSIKTQSLSVSTRAPVTFCNPKSQPRKTDIPFPTFDSASSRVKLITLQLSQCGMAIAACSSELGAGWPSTTKDERPKPATM